MVFSSVIFLFAFLPAALLGYYLIPARWQLYFLLAANLFFYGWGEPVYILLMMFSIALNYAGAMLISRFPAKKKPALALTVAANLLLLGYYKYAAFAIGNAALLFPQLKALGAPDILLPVGISFYTFQCMSYVIDVYRGDVPAQANPFLFGTYVSLFPQLIAGPIVRYSDVMLEMEHRVVNFAIVSDGIKQFAVGLAKKLLLANAMGQMWESLNGAASAAAGAAAAGGGIGLTGAADSLLGGGNGLVGAWVGAIAYSFQIYFDFSGYSDMAVGLGKMMGFRFPQNFNYPYIAGSITDFWRRWHITLSTWFRMYVYIPLGGNRAGPRRQILNLLVVWFLTGLWHGASWNFVVWGLYFCALLIAEKLFLGRLLDRAPAAVRHLYALFFVVFGWVLFYFTDFSALASYAAGMFAWTRAGAFSPDALRVTLAYLPMLAICAVAATPLPKALLGRMAPRGRAAWEAAGSIALLALCAAAVTSQSYNPFIYFRF
ncbi:MAG: MBOAT family protein [Clostridiales bacterium]|jgi:alginate O-acetyltransferase complex protein AlgI|nr:MBOAT family protein [Clostridiales bacterium]